MRAPPVSQGSQSARSAIGWSAVLALATALACRPASNAGGDADPCLAGQPCPGDRAGSGDSGGGDAQAGDPHAGDGRLGSCATWVGPALIPGTCDPGHDAPLAAKARRFDRAYWALHAWPYGVGDGYGLVVPTSDSAARERLRHFIQGSDEWDYAAAEGHALTDDVASWSATAGLYGGVAIAADAYRYGVLRDEGAAVVEVARAREQLRLGLEALHLHVAITGVPGVIARGAERSDLPGSHPATTPLFDGQGNPLPAEKDNGTWRADNSGGLYPTWLWVDSCSRDMLVGWATAFGAAAEVLAGDSTFAPALVARLREDARQLGTALTVVRASGYDLEIPDADGRTTFHGYLNEYAFDRQYLPNPLVRNGFNAVMALGIVAAYAFASQDATLAAYLDEELLAARGLDQAVVDYTQGADASVLTKYSGYNMAFQAFWLATRYITQPQARERLRYALHHNYYDRDDQPRQPREMGQSLFDFVYAAGLAGSAAGAPMSSPPDAGAVARGLETLLAFPSPPWWNTARTNCSAQEISLHTCQLDNGDWVAVAQVPPDNVLQASAPVPIAVRPWSSYVWRSNPYEPNGDGDTATMANGIDFRWAYWLGRWAR